MTRTIRWYAPREPDPQLVELMRSVSEGLADARPHDRPRAAPGSVRTWAWLILLIMSLLAIGVDLARTRRSIPEDAGALVEDVGRFLGDGNGASTDLLLTAVPVLDDTKAIDERGRLLMKSSQAAAIEAAAACLGIPRSRVTLTLRSNGISGGSAGLMFALATVTRLSGVDLAHGRRVAGTGAIAPDGTVGPVSALALKAGAAEEAGAQIFLVPAGQVPDALPGSRRMRVIGVRTLREAVRLLNGTSWPCRQSRGA